MTKAQKRERIKVIYPLACAGDDAAIRELAQLVRPKDRKTRCVICGTIMWSRIKEPRCIMHDPRRASMRKTTMLATRRYKKEKADTLRWQAAYLKINNGMTIKEIGSRLGIGRHMADYYWDTAKRVIRGQEIYPY